MGLTKKNKIIIFGGVAIALFLLVIFGAVVLTGSKTIMTLIKIGDQKISVEIAASPLAQYRGLSGRPDLCADCGMLFNFNDSQEREFVMRDMKFPLDIIFINRGRIIKIADNLPPEGNKPVNVYRSDSPADQVLEVNAGYCSARGLEVGAALLKESEDSLTD